LCSTVTDVINVRQSAASIKPTAGRNQRGTTTKTGTNLTLYILTNHNVFHDFHRPKIATSTSKPCSALPK
jgi:hypothetical protein